MNELIKRTPEVIAVEINSIKSQTRQIILTNSIEIGRRLIEAKELIGHGGWELWLKESVDYSQSTAENLIRIFNEYGSKQITLLDDNLKSQTFVNLSYSQALALLGLPSEQRENFVKENDIDKMSTRELQKAIKEKKALANKLNDVEGRYQLEHKDNEKNAEIAEKLKVKLKTIESKHKEELTNREAEIENYKTEIKRINNELKAAVNNKDSKEIEKLQKSLQESMDKLQNASLKINELEEQLKEKPVDVTETIVEKVPEEIQKELEELRLKAKQNEDKAAVKFSVVFDQVIKGFNDLLSTLNEVQDKELNEKYKGAAKGLISKMMERL